MRKSEESTVEEMPPQIAAGKVLWHFSMSLDGYVAGPEHSMDWLAGAVDRPGLEDEYIGTTGAILGGRDGHEAFRDVEAYGGAWTGPEFVLTHHPQDAVPRPGTTFLDCDVAEALQIAKDAAGGKNVEVLSASIGRQLLERGLIDEIDLHVVPVLLGDGIRLYDNPGGVPVRLDLLLGPERKAAVNLRYRPTTP
jgi:dihydrofolate reductase